ncbi:hypothetical protein CcaverHIS002_0300490 [Cutaneotrichosporon cavernicola]|nr:hypothetical protein CcaverHIS002_0300490 [Cutaneotrichosporon cavernicola]
MTKPQELIRSLKALTRTLDIPSFPSPASAVPQRASQSKFKRFSLSVLGKNPAQSTATVFTSLSAHVAL